MAATQDEAHSPGDGDLIEAVRHGSTEAYGELYERHAAAARNMARQVADSPSEADDLVSEAFARVLGMLRSGRGPSTAFRAYLLTSVRHTAYDRTRRDRRIRWAEDVESLSGAEVSVPFTDTAVAGLERSLAGRAFASLPERWQTVLWHIEIEEQKPAEVAPLLGLTPNGTAALAYRAREGLRQAYLQVHLGQLDHGAGQCRATVERLGAWARSGLSKRETAQVEAHLDHCDRCRPLAAELVDVNGGLRAVVAPLVLGLGAVGYLSASSGSAAAGATAGGSMAGGAAAGSVASAASALPRQVLTTIATGAVMATAVTFGLTIDGARKPPASAPRTPPAPSAPAVPGPPAGPPRSPVSQAPAPAPQDPSESPQAPPPGPGARLPLPPPAAADLAASWPGAPVELVAGEKPAPLPIGVHNNGGAASPPVTVRLSMPPGVTADLPGAARTEPAGTVPQSTSGHSNSSAATVRAQGSAGPPVRCARLERTARCTSTRGLHPGESLHFAFRVSAAREATGGQATVTVTAGDKTVLTAAAVPVEVRPPRAEPVPGIGIRTSAWDRAPWFGSRIRVIVTNTGRLPGTAGVTFTLPHRARVVGMPSECAHTGHTVRCTTSTLVPGDSSSLSVWLAAAGPGAVGHPPGRRARPLRDASVTVDAALATARAQDTVTLRIWWPVPSPALPAAPSSGSGTAPSPAGSRPPDCEGSAPPGRDHETPCPLPAEVPTAPGRPASPQAPATSDPSSVSTPPAPPTSPTPPDSPAPPTSPAPTEPPTSESSTPSETPGSSPPPGRGRSSAETSPGAPHGPPHGPPPGRGHRPTPPGR